MSDDAAAAALASGVSGSIMDLVTVDPLHIAVSGGDRDRDAMQTCARCNQIVLANSNHEEGCRANQRISDAAKAVAEMTPPTIKIEMSSLPTPPPPPVTVAVAAPSAAGGAGDARAHTSAAPHSNSTSGHDGDGDSDDGDGDGDDNGAGGRMSRTASAAIGEEIEVSKYPREMPALAHGSGVIDYPIEAAVRITSFYSYILACSAMVFIGCLVGVTHYGTATYDMGEAYWDFGSDITAVRVTGQTRFRASVAAGFLATLHLLVHVIWHVCLSLLHRTSRVRNACVMHLGHAIMAEYYPFEALAQGVLAMLLYPLLQAVSGERDGLRMFLVSGLAMSWQFLVYGIDYFASPARYVSGNASQYNVEQRKRYRTVLFIASVFMQVFVYAPIFAQSAVALPSNDPDPDIHVGMRAMTVFACLIVDAFKAIMMSARVCGPPSVLSGTVLFLVNKVLSFVVFATIVLSASFL